MAEIYLKPLDAAEIVKSPERLMQYLKDALADPDLSTFLAALGVVARSKGITDIARNAGVSRTTLYRALAVDGHPEFGTVVAVLHSLGLRLNVLLM